MDTLYPIETPEGVSLNLQLAGPVPRCGAWLIDVMIRMALYVPTGFLLSSTGKLGIGVFMIMLFLLEWFYPVVFELLWGATPGKRALGLKVVHTNGTPVRWQASMIRNLLRSADFLPLFYGFGVVAMLCNARFQRLGDLAAGTLVVHHQKNQSTLSLPEVAALQPPVALSLLQRQAILAFAERYTTLTTDRAAELAGYLTSWHPPSDIDPVNRVLGYAHWYAETSPNKANGKNS
ncbi:MAG: RDD family protein [Methylococcales bacterium]